MIRSIPKALLGALALTMLLLLASVSACIYFFSAGAYDGAFQPHLLSVSASENGERLFDTEAPVYQREEEHSLSFENKEESEVSILLFSGKEQIAKLSLLGGEEKSVTLSVPKGALSMVALSQNASFAYVGDGEALLPASDAMKDGGDVVFFGDVICPAVTLSAPFRLFGDFSFQELSFETQRAGRIVVCPSDPFRAKLYVSAPEARVYLKNFALDCEASEQDYYVKAKSLGDRSLSPMDYPISSFEMLERLADAEAIPRLCENARISFLESFSLRSSLAFSHHVSLDFKEKLDFSDYDLTFSSSKEGTFFVTTAFGATPSAAELIFLAPNSTLMWEGGSIPLLSTVEKTSNLKQYNGVETSLGGEGSGIPTLTLSADENSFLSEDAVFTQNGNCLSAVLPFSVSLADLENASFTLSCENGEAHLQGSLADGKVVSVDSDGNTRTFAILAEREKNLIPIVHLETENGREITSKSQYVSASFSLDGEGTEIPSLSETHIRIRGRGNSTWKWEKKPYKIHFDEPTSILGLPAAEEWALFANYADKSLMRNKIAQTIASKLSFSYCPTQQYVDLFLNGEYLGVYTLGEHLEAGVGRVEVAQDMSRRDCGYFLEAGGVVSGVDVKGMNYFHAGLVKFVLIKQPEYNTLTSEQFDFIKNYMLAADAAVKAGEGYEAYLDMETLIDWMIVIELSNNTDCAWRRSTYFVKEPGGKLVMGPVWDFDLAFGNFSKDVKGFDTWVSTSEDDYVGETWSTHLLQDPEFQKAFRKRWDEVKTDLIETALNTIDEDYLLLAPSAAENFDRWKILGRKVAFERHDTKNYKTYESQIDYLKNFLLDRAAWIDAQVEEW